jgi:DNA-binding transcriptional MerR regulator
VDGWTLDQLAERVADALAVGYDGPPSGRVRDVPDRRAIRWYVTLGLVDRGALRGRTALYGERQLLQLVAIKRLQSTGASLVEIQERLAGAPEGTLRAIAELPDASSGAVGPAPAPRPGRFWAATPARHASPPPTAEVATAVLLPAGLTLVLPPHVPPPDPALLAAIRAAALPLLTVLGLDSAASESDHQEGTP